MKKVKDFFRKGNIIPVTLVASALIGFLTVMSLLALPGYEHASTSMYLSPQSRSVEQDQIFTVAVVVESSIPVNAFAGELLFNNDTLEVQSIDYNTSIADLWAQRPWYSNGAGTLNFIGGTTRKGGFVGDDTLITVTFKAKQSGAGTLRIKDAQVLQHDGLGTNAPLSTPLEALFIVVSPTTTSAATVNLITEQPSDSTYQVVTKLPSTDLNADGKQTFADVSVLLLNIGSTNVQFDLNMDGVVDLLDLQIVVQAK